MRGKDTPIHPCQAVLRQLKELGRGVHVYLVTLAPLIKRYSMLAPPVCQCPFAFPGHFLSPATPRSLTLDMCMFKGSTLLFVFPDSFPSRVFCCWLQSSIFLSFGSPELLSNLCIQFLSASGTEVARSISMLSKHFREGNLSFWGCHGAWI